MCLPLIIKAVMVKIFDANKLLLILDGDTYQYQMIAKIPFKSTKIANLFFNC